MVYGRPSTGPLLLLLVQGAQSASVQDVSRGSPFSLTCPPAVRIEAAHISAAAGLPELTGWQSHVDDGPVRLSGANLFEGPPAEGAVLKPGSSTANGMVSTWRFAGSDAGGRFLSCDYAQGLVRLQAPVPAGAVSCTVTTQRQRPQGTLSATFSCR